MGGDVIHGFCQVAKAEIATVDGVTDGEFEVLTVITLAENRGTNPSAKAVIPEGVETPLGEQFERTRQLLSHHEEALVSAGWVETGRLPALVPKIPGVILISTYEVPVGNILHTIHADAINAKIAHPARDIGVHQGASGRVVGGVP